MQQLTKKEWEDGYLHNEDIGQSFFMGGFKSDADTMCVHAREEIIYFNENDMKAIRKYNEMMKIQCEESKEYMDML